MDPYRLELARLPGGERLPFLCDSVSGIPDFDIMVYVLSQVRAVNRATATVTHVLRALKVLRLSLDLQRIDLEERLREFRLFQSAEIDQLASHCQWTIKELNCALEEKLIAEQSKRVSRLSSKQRKPEYVGKPEAEARLRYISGYVQWKANGLLLRIGVRHQLASEFSKLKKTCLDAIALKIPGLPNRNQIGQREGLDKKSLAILVEVIHPSSPRNPWKNEHVRVRNYLIIRWLLEIGIRRGELLGIKIRDIDLRQNEILIVRRADDPEDPRRLQPNAKTLDRVLGIPEDLADLTRDYTLRIRKDIRGARKHNFLFVANGGRPLSLAAFNEIFNDLRSSIPELPAYLTGHVMRHTWNDEFSEKIDNAAKPISPDEEKNMRNYHNGWSPNSQTAQVYLRRTTKRKAKEVSESFQKKAIKGTQLDA